MKKQHLIGMRKKGEEGFTLLEYAAGAAVLLGASFLMMQAFTGNLNTYFTNISDWLNTTAITATTSVGGGNNGGGTGTDG